MKKTLIFIGIFIMLLSVSAMGEGADDGSVKEFLRAPRIIGGVEAERGAWPWLAALVYSGKGSYFDRQFCGGSLVDPNWIVTAAHCFAGVSAEEFTVVLGLHDLENDTGVEIPVRSVIVHPDYDNQTNDSDIALLELTQAATFETIRPYIGESGLDGLDSTIIGWGNMSKTAEKYAKELQQVTLPVVTNEECDRAYGQLYGKGAITDNMLCAGDALGEQDACQGDSGGPLIVQDGGDWTLAGVVSWGEGCAEEGFYGVYSRVSSFENFIYSHVPQPATTTTTVPSTTTTVPPTTTTTMPGTTTTTIDEDDDLCLAELLYGKDEDETNLLRAYRDSVLSTTPEGQDIIRMYYEWSPGIRDWVKQDEQLRKDMRTVFDSAVPLIKKQVQ